jgi:hypothetical protein
MSLISAGMGLTMAGPGGVLITLGIETVISDLATVTRLYNYFSVFTLLIIGLVASQRDARFISILMPFWAALCMFAGWLKYPDMGAGFGIIVVSAVFAIFTYMQETRHERFGIAGPGNTIVKIFMALMILQCAVVFVNSSAIFPDIKSPLAATPPEYSNIQQQSNFNTINGVGGFSAPVVDIITLGTQLAFSFLKLFLACLISIAAFSVILAQVFPFITAAGAIGVAFLVLVQFAIWGMYMLFALQMFFKPSIDPGW